MELYTIIETLLGGGALATVIGFFTMRSSMLKARAEADSAKAEALKAKAEVESVLITNVENATRVLNDNIVVPLKKELNETREQWAEAKRAIASNTREMARLRKAIDAANSCRYSDDCPVLRRVRDDDKKSAIYNAEQSGSADECESRQFASDVEESDLGSGAAEPGDGDSSGG